MTDPISLYRCVEYDVARGFIAISRNRVELYEAKIRWFIVDDAIRGNGVGRKLLHAALEHCREIGVPAPGTSHLRFARGGKGALPIRRLQDDRIENVRRMGTNG